jgi:hypothetical protein
LWQVLTLTEEPLKWLVLKEETEEKKGLNPTYVRKKKVIC